MGSDVNRKEDKQWPQPNGPIQQNEEQQHAKLWGVFLFALIGATATTLAVGQLRHTIKLVYSQLASSQPSNKKGSGRSFRSAFQEEARKRYNRRLQEEYEEEMERVERIRRMQDVFNRERNKHRRGYERWREAGGNAYHQHFNPDDWYWKTDASFRDHSYYQQSNYRQAPSEGARYPLSHHYSILGLDRMRATPYTEAEIKTAFRAKAKEFHPDQNQNNKEDAEAKFKEVMTSYEAIKQERKNMGF